MWPGNTVHSTPASNKGRCPVRRPQSCRDASLPRRQVRSAANAAVETLESRQFFSISYLTEGPSVLTGDQPVEVIAADFNNDGKLDATTGDYTSKTVSVFLNDGTGAFTLSQTIQLPADVKQLDAADLNGDGKLDLIVREFNGNNFKLLPGNGDGTFAAPHTLNGSGGTSSFDLGDIDSDGDIDIVTGRSSGGQDGIYLFRNKGNFEFDAGEHFDGIGGVHHVHLADVNEDGSLDVLTVGPSLDAPAGLMLNNGAGQFPTHTGLTTRYDSQKDAVTAADVNSDGNLDAIVQYQGGSFDVLLGNGNGTFAAPTGESSLGSADIAVIDISGDGKLDIVSGSDLYGAVCINEGNGDGSFGEDDKEYLFGSNVTDFAVGDFNGDGKIDVIVADKGDDELIFVQNTKTGGPTSPPPAPPPPTPGVVDLTASVQAQLPSAAVGGQTKGKAAVAVTNAGSDTLSGNVTVSLYASADGTLDGNDTLITSVVKKLKLSAGKAKSVAMKFLFPAVADGDYQILGKVESAGETDAANNTSATGTTVRIAAPFVDLLPAVQSTAAKKGKLKATIDLQNLGNVTAAGPLTFTLTATPEAGGAPVAIATVSKSVNLKSGAAKKAVLNVALPAGLAAGNYQLSVAIDGLGDAATGNNSAIGSTPFTVA